MAAPPFASAFATLKDKKVTNTRRPTERHSDHRSCGRWALRLRRGEEDCRHRWLYVHRLAGALKIAGWSSISSLPPLGPSFGSLLLLVGLWQPWSGSDRTGRLYCPRRFRKSCTAGSSWQYEQAPWPFSTDEHWRPICIQREQRRISAHILADAINAITSFKIALFAARRSLRQ